MNDNRLKRLVTRRLQEDKVENILLYFLMLFLVYSLFAYMLLGLHIEIAFQIMMRLEGIIGIALLYYGFRNRKAFPQQTLHWCIFIVVYLILEIVNSSLYAEVHTPIIGEIVFWLFFFGLFLYGASDSFWTKYTKWGVVIVLIACVLSLIELYYGNFTYLRAERDTDANSYLYKVQIGFVPLFLLLGYYLLEKKKNTSVFMIIAFVLYVILQFIFQKRLPLVRCVMTVIMLLYVLKGRIGFSKTIPNAILLFSIILIGVISFAPKEYVNATMDRFTKEGSVSQTAQDDERYHITEDAMTLTFSTPRTILFGQGLGGAVRGYFWGKTVIDKTGKEMDGLESFEVGAANAIFKYGIIFFIAMYGFILKLLLNFKKYRHDSLALSCWLYLFVFFVFNFIGESFPNYNSIIFTAALAPCMGYLASFKPVNA